MGFENVLALAVLGITGPPEHRKALLSAPIRWTSNGTWHPTPDCPAPRVVLVLYGHVRSFVYTRQALARMAQASSADCAFTIAVTEENVCDPDRKSPGWCKSVKGTRLKWSAFVHSAYDAAKVMRESSDTFGHRFAATVYEKDPTALQDAGWKTNVWSKRIQHAITQVQKTHKFSYRANATIVVRTRFDMLPTTYMDFTKEQRANPTSLFFRNGKGIVYTSDVFECQPDHHLYTTLDTFMRFGAPMWMNDGCWSHAPTYMEDWTLCKRHLLRSNTPIINQTLRPHPIGRESRLYCTCPLSLDEGSFEALCVPWNTYVHLRSKHTVQSCPQLPGGSTPPVGTGPVGILRNTPGGPCDKASTSKR
eukprot:Hpha_TRINITY_DN1617_c0_g1::TRINITY_DN1617_c0_g1_i1::g.48721::m.48721